MSTASKKTPNWLPQKRSHDPYRTRAKLQGPVICPNCKALYDKGRWSWHRAQPGTAKQLCPSCRRIADRVPAGILTLKGEFVKLHQQELFNLINNSLHEQNKMHPLKNIIAIEVANDETIIVTTTDAALAHNMIEDLKRAYKGQAVVRYGDVDPVFRGVWQKT